MHVLYLCTSVGVCCNINNTVFPRNLAMVRFNFEALFYVVTIQGQLDFEGPDQHLRPVHVQITTEKYKHRVALLNTDRDSLLLTIACLYF